MQNEIGKVGLQVHSSSIKQELEQPSPPMTSSSSHSSLPSINPSPQIGTQTEGIPEQTHPVS